MPFAKMIDHLPDAFYALDSNWRFTYINKAAESLLQRKNEELVGKSIWEEFPIAVGRKFYDEFLRAVHENRSVQFEEYYPPYQKWYGIRAYPFEQGLAVHVIDITITKKELDDSQLQYKFLFENNPDAVFSLDMKGNYLSVNRAWEELFEYSIHEVHLKTFAPLIVPENLAIALHYFHQALNGEPQNYDTCCLSKSGNRIEINMTMIPIIANDKIVGVYGFAKDITDRIQTQEKLMKSEELYQLISENSQDVISYTTPDGICQYISPAITKLGYSPEEIIGKAYLDFYHPDDLTNIIHKLPEEDITIFTTRVKHKNGRYFWYEFSRKRIRDEQGNHMKTLGVARDVTERIEAEELIRKSEKLTLAGQLAAGIAHEIRNPLTAIKGFLQMMGSGFTLEPKYVDIMHSELDRIEYILNELLLLAKPQSLHYQVKCLKSILYQVITLLETEALLKNVQLVTRIEEDDMKVSCDENQLKQVFINFIKNGIEAMPKGGELVIELKKVEDQALLLFHDQGCGIPQDQLSQIGQPFYTTKEKGTGLGLAVSFTIIENHKGAVQVESKESEGTTFTICLPLYDGP